MVKNKIALYRKEIIIGIFICVITAAFCFGIAEPQEILSADASFEVQQYEEEQVIFSNFFDGYRLVVPSTLAGKINCSQLYTRFENETMSLDIYKEHLTSPQEKEQYVYYSNRFLKNKEDHTTERSEKIALNGFTAYVTQWSRASLTNVEGDKHYYACVDLVKEQEGVYTLFFKSAHPFESAETYLSIARTLTALNGKSGVDGMQDNEVQQNNFIPTYWSKETKEAYENYFGSETQLTWGIFEFTAPEDFSVLKALEEQLDFQFNILLYYKGFDKKGIQSEFQAALQNAKVENRMLEISLQTSYQEGGNMVYDILNGDLDDYIMQFATIIKETGQPVLFRLCNEMNGDWCEYSSFHTARDTDVFKEMYKYVFHKFEEAGALPYTIWVWNPNEKSFPNYKWNHELMYYPGDAYVNVIGLTGYNTGTYYEGEQWRSFDEIYGDLYEEMQKNFHQPMMITEFASSSVGGDKAAWIKDMFLQIKKYDKIKVAIWWNGRDLDSKGNVARPYWLNENQQTLDAFKTSLEMYR